jgi:predicted dehydrogenase
LSKQSTRRDFLSTSATLATGATLAALAPTVHAAGSDVLRVGLIGCGGRGTGAAKQALHADPNVKLVALGDLFPDRVQQCLNDLKEDKNLAAKVDVKPDHCFSGFDNYKDLLASGVDVVLLATPPHFRPAHLKAAIAAGKHVFCEKPVAVDGPGVRSVLETCAEAKRKNLSLVSGLCWRYHNGMRETFKHVHGGAVGDILTLHTNYNAGGLWSRSLKEKAEKGWSDMEWQVRNWLYFTWLSGDHNVEQHVHSLDKMAWAMKDEYPEKCVGLGGRQARIAPDFGNIFDHHAVVYEYKNGVKCFSYCRQQVGTDHDVSDHIYGTKGICHINAAGGSATITGEHPWQNRPRRGSDDMYQTEHNELFASIRSGKPINNGDYMTKSTLMAIMGRMATYTGQVITWDMALNCKEDLTPPRYEFGPLAIAPIARPGITKYVLKKDAGGWVREG